MRLESGFQPDLVEALLFDFAVRFGPAAGSSVLLGAAGGASELSWASLLLCACAYVVSVGGPLAHARVHLWRVACGVWADEQAGHADSFESSVLEQCVARLQVSKLLRASLQLTGCLTASGVQGLWSMN